MSRPFDFFAAHAGVHSKPGRWPLLAVCLALLGCATAPEPSFFERMLTGTAAGGRPIAPELRLECSVPDAEVLLDGVLQGVCSDFESSGLKLDERPHRLEVRKAGYRTFYATVDSGRARTTLPVELTPVF